MLLGSVSVLQPFRHKPKYKLKLWPDNKDGPKVRGTHSLSHSGEKLL